MGGYPKRAGRRALDLTNRSAMGRAAARQVSAVPDVPPPLPAMGRPGHAGRGARALAKDLLAPGSWTGRDVHRRRPLRGRKRGRCSWSNTPGKGSKMMAIAERDGLPVAAWIGSASPHESRFVEATVEQRSRGGPERMIGDRAYDSDPLDERLQQHHGVQLIAPHKGTAASPRRRTGASCGDIAGAGRSRDCLPGCITFVGWSPVGSTTRPTSWARPALMHPHFDEQVL